MSELRHDAISDRWVIVAENRADKPDDFSRPAGTFANCPFCPGNEAETPEAVATYFLPGKTAPGEWQVRVVPNKFPAVSPCGANGKPRPDIQSLPGLHLTQEGTGIHEVVIESPAHVLSLSDLSPEQVYLVFLAYRDRLTAYRRQPELAYGMVFKNVGAAGGASLEHAHSQIIATSFVPSEVRRQLEAAESFQRQKGKCSFCWTLAEEFAGGQRAVATTSTFAAFCPFASRFPYETKILPLRHASRFEESSDEELRLLADFVRDLVGRIERALGRVAYNYILHTEPFDTARLDHYHWHIEILPRITRTAGFEWGAGCHINPVPPEEAAAALRSIS